MKLLILTTQTTHHARFVQELIKTYPETQAVLETRGLKAPFNISHDYLAEQDRYERNLWFGGDDVQVADLVPTISAESINDPQVIAHIQSAAPDVVVVFGTGKINPEVINAVPQGRMLNLHGGDPEEYRGLDTHLWAIYHGEFDQLITCLHEVAPALDTGAIVGRMALPLRADMALHELRAENTQICIDLTLGAVKELEDTGAIAMASQTKKGRYYSFMPSDLKEICVQKFKRHTAKL